ncbi:MULTISPECIES: MFS transporter [unclassified Streptomyces]|uniref:MFS transporter n=1 Tax=unclassified Streptomyces TaxID=2593676 RepID=UPI002DD8648C|nr:MFS transporter [Streptomyces sp. NBC_00243]WRZ25002.1 MFS transporter [Streptomyces sp. NBC_00243]
MSPSTALPARGGAKLALLVVGLCWLVVLFDGLDMFIYGSVLPHMLETKALGIDPSKAGDVGSYATFGMLIGALSSGTVSDWVGRKKTIIVSTAVFSLASALCASANSLDTFSLGRFLAGLGLGGLLPSAITLVTEYAPRGRGALVVGSLMTAHQTGGIVAAFVAKWTGDWRTSFWICVIPLFIGVPLAAKYLPESMAFLQAKGRDQDALALADRYGVDLAAKDKARQAAGERWGALAALFRGRLWVQTLFFWLASFGGLLLVYGVSQWLPTMMRAAGYDLGSSLNFVIVINLGGIVGMLIGGRLTDKFGGSRIAALWFGATAVGVYLLSVHMPLALTYIVVFLTGLFLFSAQAMIYATVAARADAENRATAVGWVSGMGRFGAVFGPWLGGQLLATGSNSAGFVAFAIAGVFSLVFVSLTGLRSVRSTPDVEVPKQLATTG